MKRLFLLLNAFLFLSCTDSEPSACNVVFDLIKKDLNHPDEAKHHRLDCVSEKNSDGTYTVFSFVTAKNSFGVKQKILFKYRLEYNGINEYDLKNWMVLEKKSEKL